MAEQDCPKCKEPCESEDTGKPGDSYYCGDCGYGWYDYDGYVDRLADHADYLRKQAKEGV